jgi:hypothetical protein
MIGFKYNYAAESYKDDTRIIALISRAKDGNADQTKRLFRVSHCPTEFDKTISDFEKIAAPLDRIYISAAPRSIKKAARMFQQRQLDSSYDEDPLAFYRGLESRWISCLMNPQCAEYGVWFFDCDSVEEYEQVSNEIPGLAKLTYPTKNGCHILVPPFNKSKLSDIKN